MKWIRPAVIEGEAAAPPSKSMTIRAAAAAFLSHRPVRIHSASDCDDAAAALRVVSELGVEVAARGSEILVSPGPGPRSFRLACGESGLCLRLFLPIAALSPQRFILTASGSLRSRPSPGVESVLADLGCRCRSNGGLPPFHVQGPLKGGEVRVDGTSTSQFLSGLLMSLPVAEGDSRILVSRPASKPYLRMTLSILSDFAVDVEASPALDEFFIRGGQAYRARDYRVEGDWSGAAFLLTAGALAGRVTVTNLPSDSHQADIRIVEALKAAGAAVAVAAESVTVERDRLEAFEFDAGQAPDLFPPLVALACFCRGRTILHGAGRLHHKESDRAATLISEFSKLGASIGQKDDRLEIEGGGLSGGTITSQGDHRIAMAGAVAGLRSLRGVGIAREGCVSKSYPRFYADLESLMRRST